MEIEDFVIAVRTYKRSEAFPLKTYKVLEENGLLDRLYIFVANEEEKELYLKSLEGKPYKELIVGVPGCARVANFIVNYFPVGKPIVFCDDDSYRFFNFNSAGKYNKRATNLKEFILDGFKTTKEMGTNGFTVSYLSNKLYLKDKPFKEFRPYQMAGAFYACFNEPEILLIAEGASHCDDSVRTVQVMEKYGGVLVYWWAGFETYYCKEPGGIQASGERLDTKGTCDLYYETTPNAKLWLKAPHFVKEQVWQLRMFPISTLKKNLASVGRTFTTRSFAWPDFILL
jgi:hypothetical protein